MANLSSAAFTLLLSSFWKRHRAQARSEREPSPQPPTAMVAAAAAAALRGRRAAEETRAKRAGKKAGKQFVAQPKNIAKKTAGYR